MNDQNTDSDFADSPVAQLGLPPEQMTAFLRQHPEAPGQVGLFEIVLRLANEVRAASGRVFLVGGAVRDELLGLVPKDFDLEVHGLSVTSLEKILISFGVQEPSGKSFGTYKLPVSNGKIEVALPRRDSQVGDRHTDVEVDVQPHLGLTEAARRREYTIGAIYKDVLTGEMFDPFKGIDDLEKKILRMVDTTTFGDDALRVLRGAAHAARFDLTIEVATAEAMKTMVGKMGLLPRDRLREEWMKMLVSAKKPSRGLNLLHNVGVLDRWYPELAILWSIPQDPEHHPEGTVGQHTLLVVDAATELAAVQQFSPAEKQELMLAALLHDSGKPVTTKNIDGALHSYGHEVAGIKPSEEFLERLGIPVATIHRITSLVANHMRPAQLYRERTQVTDRALKKLTRDIGFAHIWSLVTLAEADHRGRGPFVTARGTTEFPNTTKYHTWWQEQISRLQLDKAPEPILWGRDLVEGSRSWPTGPLIGEAVRLAEELALSGTTRDQVLSIIDTATSPQGAVDVLRQQVTEQE